MLVVTDKMKRKYKEVTGKDWGDDEERILKLTEEFIDPIPKEDLLKLIKKQSNEVKKSKDEREMRRNRRNLLFLGWGYNHKMDGLIIQQQNIVSELRATKSSNSMIKKAVKILMKLKSEFKEQNGREWEPPVDEN